MSLARSFLIINLSEIVFVVSSYFIHIYLAKLFSTEEYGRYGIIIMLSTMTIVFIGDGIPKALSKFISQHPQREKVIKRKAAIAQSIVVGTATLLYFLLAPYIAKFLNDESLTGPIRLSTLIIPTFAAASFYNNYFNGLKKFGMQAAQRAIRSTARLIAILALAYLYQVTGAIIGYIIAPLLVFIFSFFADKKTSSVKQDKKDFPYKDLLRFGMGVVSFMVAYKFLTSIDLLLVKRLVNSDYWAGIYNAVLVVGQIPFYFFSNMAFIMLPTISNLLEKKTVEDAQKLIKKSLRYILILMIPTVLTISIFAKEIFSLLYTDEYIEGELSLRIFVVGIGALTIFYIFTFILNGANNVRISANLTWVGLILNLVLNYLLIPIYGIVGAAISTTSTSFFLLLISFMLMQKIFGKFVMFLSVFRIVAAGLLTSGFFYFLFTKITVNKYNFIPLSIIFFAIYFVILFVIKEINKKDFTRMKNIFLKKNNKAVA